MNADIIKHMKNIILGMKVFLLTVIVDLIFTNLWQNLYLGKLWR